MYLPKVIIDELRRKAERVGMTVEEYLLDILTNDEEPKVSARKYLESAYQLLNQAKEELRRGNLRQASEKLWGSCALAIKAHALVKRGIRLRSHKELWIYKNEVAAELGDWVRIVFKLANLMHINFYEDIATKEDIEDVIPAVEKLIKEVSTSIGTSLK